MTFQGFARHAQRLCKSGVSQARARTHTHAHTLAHSYVFILWFGKQTVEHEPRFVTQNRATKADPLLCDTFLPARGRRQAASDSSEPQRELRNVNNAMKV